MLLIEKEKKASEDYMLAFEIIDDKKIVKLTRDNVARVEAMIKTDSDYRDSVKEDKGIIYKGASKTDENIKYVGSSYYWLKQLKEIIDDTDNKKSTEEYNYSQIIKYLVIAIDNENSTHLNSDNKGREAVAKRISAYTGKELKKYLEFPGAEYELIRVIAEPDTKKYPGEKNHFSFATKFCHYVCMYLFEGTEAADNFSIYDNVLKKALPFYIKKYLTKNVNIKEYENNYFEYIKYIDEIRTKLKENNEEISKNGFDHLLWYFHKGRD